MNSKFMMYSLLPICLCAVGLWAVVGGELVAMFTSLSPVVGWATQWQKAERAPVKFRTCSIAQKA